MIALGDMKSDFLAIAVQSRALAYQQQQQQQQEQQQQQQIAEVIQKEIDVSIPRQQVQQRVHEVWSGALVLTSEAEIALDSAIRKKGAGERVDEMASRLPASQDPGLVYLSAFALTFFVEIRDRICGDKDKDLNQFAGLTAQGVASGFATWLMTGFGVTNPMALGIGATVLFVLAGASRGAFCKMTEDEMLKSFGISQKL